MPWDVFISHASEDKDAVAVPLAAALEAAGLSVWLDKNQIRLGDSIPESIQKGLATSRFGIVILSPRFFEKRWAQAELAALLQREIAGKQVILPVYYEITSEIVAERAPLLGPKLGMPWTEGIPRLVAAIVAAVGEQATPISVSPPTLPNLHPGKPARSLVLILTPEKQITFVQSRAIRVQDAIQLTLLPRDGHESAVLANLRRAGSDPVAVAFTSTAHLGLVADVTQTIEDDHEVWDVILHEEERFYGDRFMQDIAFNTMSADDLAVLRARRLLLNETPVRPRKGAAAEGSAVDLNDTAFQLFVEGFGVPLRAKVCPFPSLYRDLREDPAFFLAAARLVGVMWLRLSMTIETITTLDLSLPRPGTLHVLFEGRRHRRYSNVEPPIVRVEGDCVLE